MALYSSEHSCHCRNQGGCYHWAWHCRCQLYWLCQCTFEIILRLFKLSLQLLTSPVGCQRLSEPAKVCRNHRLGSRRPGKCPFPSRFKGSYTDVRFLSGFVALQLQPIAVWLELQPQVCIQRYRKCPLIAVFLISIWQCKVCYWEGYISFWSVQCI